MFTLLSNCAACLVVYSDRIILPTTTKCAVVGSGGVRMESGGKEWQCLSQHECSQMPTRQDQCDLEQGKQTEHKQWGSKRLCGEDEARVHSGSGNDVTRITRIQRG